MAQIHNRQRSPQRQQIKLAFVAILLILVGTVIWILSRGSGPWSSIVSITFPVLGPLVALLQWHSQSADEANTTGIIPSARKSSLHIFPKQVVDNNASVSEERGALIVHGRRSLQGATVNLGRGFSTVNLKTHFASNVIEHDKNGLTVFTSVFPSLEPGNYTAHVNSGQLLAKVTIHPGQIAEIDWR